MPYTWQGIILDTHCNSRAAGAFAELCSERSGYILILGFDTKSSLPEEACELIAGSVLFVI
jgi:hypothetical protein